MWLFPILLGVFVVLLTVLYRRRLKRFDVFKKLGIPGPEPHWLFGNIKAIEELNMYVAFQTWTKQYGKYFGIYKGPWPMLVSSDPYFLQEVFITRFSNFHSREVFCIGPNLEHGANVNMFFARGKRWKRLRSIVVPTFSKAKLKQMVPQMQKCVDILVDNFQKASDTKSPTDVYKLFQGLTLQVIAECGMSWTVESQTNPDDPFLLNCKQTFSNSATKNKILIIRIAECFPDFREHFWTFFEVVGKFLKDPNLWLMDNMMRLIDARRKDSKQQVYVDLLQLMINAEASTLEDVSSSKLAITMSDDKETDHNDFTANSHLAGDADVISGSQQKKALTPQEMQMQLFMFLIAGYETTSTALAYSTHLLALHPEVQTRVQAEIDGIAGGAENLTFEMIHQMSYLHAVIQESMRMYPVIPMVNVRTCMQECTVNGVHIPEGVMIGADVWSIHYNPELWPEPETFDPERFLGERIKGRHPLAWMPFGVGPRNCVGMRFALLEAKMALACVLRKYTLKRCYKSENPIKLKEATSITPENGVWVSILPRGQE